VDIKEFVAILDDIQKIKPSDAITALQVPGFSSPMIIQLLSYAVSCLGENEIYLEVGSYKGRTMIGAMVHNKSQKAVAVDNFSEFRDPSVTVETLTQQIKNRFADHKVDKQITFYNSDCQQFFKDHKDEYYHKVGVYFYDGNHDTDQGLAGLENALPLLADKAVIFIDDISGLGIWRSVVDFVTDHRDETAILFGIATPDFPIAQETWWNGLLILAWNRMKPGENRWITVVE
jgi:protein O-GlcNAc transferase